MEFENGNKQMRVFMPSNILLPKAEKISKWAVIACDQFTSQPEYWNRVRNYVGEEVSSLNLILPEVELNRDYSTAVRLINANMESYITNEIFTEYSNAYVYVERTLTNGKIRKGIVGMIDLEEYDYSCNSKSKIRATEKTVEKRIPPRKKIRENAALELPHVILLCDDERNTIIKELTKNKNNFRKLYELDLMEKGGRVVGWLIQGEDAKKLSSRLNDYSDTMIHKYSGVSQHTMLFAVGDGNHSLATAKACYEEMKKIYTTEELMHNPARYALVELENIYDESIRFEAIHRLIKGINPEHLLNEMKKISSETGEPVEWYMGENKGAIYLKKENNKLPVEILQPFLDEYLEQYGGTIDYIHGDEVVKRLAIEKNTVGFLLPKIEKDRLFQNIILHGEYPRKTFSMGHAQEKRYYIEARKIK